MKTSIIVRTRDEAPRLALALASFAQQQELGEIVVTDDGSIDGTQKLLREAASTLPLVVVQHRLSLGRAAASNAAAAAASGDLLIFFDGDTLAAPTLISAHIRAHGNSAARIARGETWHLRCTRLLADPETGQPRPGEAARLAQMSESERDALRVTRAQVRYDFASIHRRASPGVYPGAAPRRLHEMEMKALRDGRCRAHLWAAASGSNLSMRREAFLHAGGFDPNIDINEHRELAYRLSGAGLRLVPAEGARSYHLIHRSGWRDPLQQDGWEKRFLAVHPGAPLHRLKAYWAAIGQGAPTPDFFA